MSRIGWPLCLGFAGFILTTMPSLALCTLAPQPQPTLALGIAPMGTRLAMEPSPLTLRVNGEAVYPVTGTDGATHLAFSATIANVSAFPVTVRSIAGERSPVRPNGPGRLRRSTPGISSPPRTMSVSVQE